MLYFSQLFSTDSQLLIAHTLPVQPLRLVDCLLFLGLLQTTSVRLLKSTDFTYTTLLPQSIASASILQLTWLSPQYRDRLTGLMAGALCCWKMTKLPNCTDIGQHLLFQQCVPIICSVYVDARHHKYKLGKKTSSFLCSKTTAFAFTELAKLPFLIAR